MDLIDTEIREKEKFVLNQIKEIKDLHKSYNYQIGYKNILERANELFFFEDMGDI